MPSRRHQFLATVVPRLRGSDGARPSREEIGARNAARDRRLPGGAAPGWQRHFEHDLVLLGTGATQFPVHVLTPRSGARSTLLHLHGGAYTAGIDPFHVRWLTRLSARLGARIVLPDYPLAPEFTWQDSFAEVQSLTERWAEHADPLFLTGDSAGGGYALAIAQAMRDAGSAQAMRMVLVSPWLDLTLSSPGTDDVARDDPWLHPANLRTMGEWWAGGAEETRRWEVSPLHGDVRDLPRTHLMVGTRDCLLPACLELAVKAREAGWDLTLTQEPGAVHVYPLLPFIPEARRAWEQAVYFLKS